MPFERHAATFEDSVGVQVRYHLGRDIFFPDVTLFDGLS